MVTRYFGQALKSILVMLIAMCSAGAAESSGGSGLEERILQANQAYTEANYGLAYQKYEEVKAGGLRTAALEFNMGNTAYRLGDHALALAHYRLAQDLSPRRNDIQSNIDLLLLQAELSAPERASWWEVLPWARWFSQQESAIGLSVCLSLAFVLLTLWKLSGRWGFLSSAGLIGVVVLVFASSWVAAGQSQRPAERGVVRKDTVSVHSDATGDSLELFELRMLNEVRILETQPPEALQTLKNSPKLRAQNETSDSTTPVWVRIQFQGDTQGWVPLDAVEIY